MSRRPPYTDCYLYVRETYGVPAYVGVRVRVGDQRGVLVAARHSQHYIHVHFDGERFSVPCHPRDGVEYLIEGATRP
jgi:hypothetical protein